jgi:opacity protein-like surface antigen
VAAFQVFRRGRIWVFGDRKDSDNVSDFAINANVFYHFQEQRRATPYLGFGVNLNFFTIDVPGDDESQTELGLNLLGGMLLPVSSGVTAFVEGRYVATELDQIMLLGGMTFSFSQGSQEADF